MELYPAGPTPVEIAQWIKGTYPDTAIASAMGAAFFSLDESHWSNFATIVTTDEHNLGEPSKLSRPGVFRLSIATSKATFERIVGRMENPDYAALDQILPHPVYVSAVVIGASLEAGAGRTHIASRERTAYRLLRCDLFTRTASRISAFSAASFTGSSSWRSMARTALLSRRALKNRLGSFI